MKSGDLLLYIQKTGGYQIGVFRDRDLLDQRAPQGMVWIEAPRDVFALVERSAIIKKVDKDDLRGNS